MKNKFIVSICCLFIFLVVKNESSANEFIFDSSEINITNNGNLINAGKGIAKSNKNNIIIEANKFQYDRNLSLLNASKGIVKSIKDNIEIRANNFTYDENLSLLNAIGDVEIKDLSNKTIIKSESIFYYTENKIIESKKNSSIRDAIGNIFSVKSFKYTILDSIVKIDNAEVIDVEKNLFKIDKAFINLKKNKLIGKDISIDFNNTAFQKDNEPRLKGNSISIDRNISKITKGVFTTCKKNDDCPPWQLSAKEIKHDKSKKIIYYKDAWLKLYDKPIFYFPKFFHPDPTVKRQSGFLMPSFVDSSSLGGSFNVPYYHVISNNRDLTLKPKFFSNEKVLLQSEYRQVNKKSNHIFDFSFTAEKNETTKNHFFSETSKKLDFNNFDESNLNLKLQQTSDDTYLKTYKMKSPIIQDTSTLKSSLEINAYRKDLSFNADFQVYENLAIEKTSDRYEFIYPSYDLIKQIKNNTNLNGNFSLNSSGYAKNYNTNIFEKVIINDFTFNSNSKFLNNGIKNNYNFLIKNINSDAINSEKYGNDMDHSFDSIFEFNSSYPLIKRDKYYKNILKPKMSLKISPSNTKNMRNEDRRIDINNIFSLNRIGSNETVEGGSSLTLGTEFSKINEFNKEIFAAKIANIYRPKKNDNLPANSSLGDKTSDIVGSLNYSPNEIFKIDYGFSLDSNLSENNYQLLGTEIKVNNFISTFEYLNENNTKNSESYITNKTSYIINDSKSLTFEIRENKKTKLTEFYNLIYQYRNDCLIAAIEYNKDYYTDRNLVPEESIFFKLTIIPFGEAITPNLKQ